MYQYIIKHSPVIYIGLLFAGVVYSIVNVDTQDGLGNNINSHLTYNAPATLK